MGNKLFPYTYDLQCRHCLFCNSMTRNPDNKLVVECAAYEDFIMEEDIPTRFEADCPNRTVERYWEEH